MRLRTNTNGLNKRQRDVGASITSARVNNEPNGGVHIGFSICHNGHNIARIVTKDGTLKPSLDPMATNAGRFYRAVKQ